MFGTAFLKQVERIIYKAQNGELVKGTIFNILLNRGDYTLVDLKVYANGEIDCLGPLSIEKLKDLLKSGKLTRTLPANSKLFIRYIGHIHSSETVTVSPMYSDNRFLILIGETIGKLKLSDDVESACIAFFREYLIEPSAVNFVRLKDAYSKLAPGRQALFEYAENKDPLIALMNGGAQPTPQERESYLNDYFEGEWIELK